MDGHTAKMYPHRRHRTPINRQRHLRQRHPAASTLVLDAGSRKTTWQPLNRQLQWSMRTALLVMRLWLGRHCATTRTIVRHQRTRPKPIS